MGWEDRNGKLYYYAKEREGGRVVSRYIGAGDLARLVEMMEAGRRVDREVEREMWRSEVAAIEREDERAEQVFVAADELMKAALHAAGFHQHKRQWRRRRCLAKK